MKCILYKKRKTSEKKPFCIHCYKRADVFRKIQAFKDSRFSVDGKRLGLRAENTGKMQSRAFKTLQERDLEETSW